MLQIHPILFGIYLLLGPGIWALMFLFMALGWSRANRLLKPTPALPDDPPHVTILIPAKDEAGGIAGCIERVLEQDYPSFDIIAIDDRSTDRTGVILDELAAATPKLHVLHIQPGDLPPGWLGKCHALATAEKLATGSWLLFVDSDVTLEPDALRRAIAVAIQRKYQAITLFTRLECHSALERLMLPMCAGTWIVMHVVALTNRNASKSAVANGQFFLILRDAYKKVGGHEAVRNQITEDVELMRLLKGAEFVVKFQMGNHLASTRMHSNLRQMFHGWARIFAGTSRRRPWRILETMTFFVVSGLSAYAALAFGIVLATRGQFDLLIAAAVHQTLMHSYLATIYALSGNQKRYAALFPVSAVIMLAILAFSLLTCFTGKLKWRDTHYGADLIAG